jgi:dTDP-4-dehydrorhamnose reductase
LFTDLEELDITDEGAVRVFFDRERPDVVVNCAAFTDVDGAEVEREAAFGVNARAPGILAAAARDIGAALIHVSTDFVFAGGAYDPYTERDVPCPINVYGESKLAGERAVLESGCRGAVVRTSWLYSSWGRNFVRSILVAASGRDEIRVVNDQWGCPTSASSLASAIVRMIPSLAPHPGVEATPVSDLFGPPAEIYHFCDTGIVSRAGFAREIIRQAGLSTRVFGVSTAEYDSSPAVRTSAARTSAWTQSARTSTSRKSAARRPVAPPRARRPDYSALDTSKITRTFGIVPRQWQEALVECLNEIYDGC